MDDPWNISKEPASDTSEYLKFEDVFDPSIHTTNTSMDDNIKEYIPLSDSEQYLIGLESKLSVVQGKTIPKRSNERKCLLNALALSREAHAHHQLHDSFATMATDEEEEDNATVNTLGSSVNPSGPTGAVLRKLIPDKVPITKEEIYRLLEADVLAKMSEDPDVNSDEYSKKENEQGPD